MTQLEIELQYLKTEIINMWSLVHSQLVKSLSAMINFDKDLAREIVASEKRVNGLELKIDQKERKRLTVQGWYIKGEMPDGTEVVGHMKRVQPKPFEMAADKGDHK